MPSRPGQRARTRIAIDLVEPGPGARVGIYARYSSDMQKKGYTIETQLRECRVYAEARGWVVVVEFIEPAVSAKYDVEDLDRRPQFAAALVAAQLGEIDVLLCHENDRWARNVGASSVSLATLRKAGIWWATADGRYDSAKIMDDGLGIAHIIDAKMNELFLQKLSRKTIKGKETRALEGWHNGHPPFGYLPPDYPPRPAFAPANWVPPRMPERPDPSTWPALHLIAEWRLARYSARQIAEALNAAGYRTTGQQHHGPRDRVTGEYVTPKQRLFTKDGLTYLLVNPFYREFAPGCQQGTIVTPSGQMVQGRHVAAWAWETWHRMEDITASLRHAPAATQSARRLYPFGGVIVCSVCRLAMRCTTHLNAHGERLLYYKCFAKQRALPCEALSTTTPAHQVNRVFGELLLQYRLGESWRDDLTELIQAMTPAPADQTSHEERRAELERRKRSLGVQFEEGMMSEEEYRRKARLLRQEEGALPRRPPTQDQEHLQALHAAETLATLPDCWEAARQSGEEVLLYEIVQSLLRPGGLVWDSASRTIRELHPYPEYMPSLALALGVAWECQGERLVCRGPVAEAIVPTKRRVLRAKQGNQTELTDDQREAVRQLIQQGKSYREIAEMFQVSRTTIYRIAHYRTH